METSIWISTVAIIISLLSFYEAAKAKSSAKKSRKEAENCVLALKGTQEVAERVVKLAENMAQIKNK